MKLKKKHKKAFTLVEIIGVLVILSIIALVAIPQIIRLYQRQNNMKYDQFVSNVTNSAELYLEQNKDLYSTFPAYVSVGTLIDKGYLKYDIQDPKNKTVIDKTTFVLVQKEPDNTLMYLYPSEVAGMSMLYPPTVNNNIACVYDSNANPKYTYYLNEAVTNRNELPSGTTVHFVNTTPDNGATVYNDVQIVVVYPDGSQAIVPVTVTCELPAPIPDTTPPVINSVSGNPTDWTNQDITLTVNATDNEGVISYSFDNGVYWQTSNSKTFNSAQNLKILAKDAEGNISSPYNAEIASRTEYGYQDVSGWSNSYSDIVPSDGYYITRPEYKVTYKTSTTGSGGGATAYVNSGSWNNPVYSSSSFNFSTPSVTNFTWSATLTTYDCGEGKNGVSNGYRIVANKTGGGSITLYENLNAITYSGSYQTKTHSTSNSYNNLNVPINGLTVTAVCSVFSGNCNARVNAGN